MATYKAKEYQSLLDVALQVYGSTGQMVKLCIENGLTLDDTLTAGQELTYGGAITTLSPLPDYLRLNNVFIATAQELLLGTNEPLEHSIEYSYEEYN
jgi:hypothetical protein